MYLHRHEIVARRGDQKETEMQEKAAVISCQWISLLYLQQVPCGCRKSSLSMREHSCSKYLLESISRNIKKQVKNKQTKNSKPLHALRSLVVLSTVNWLWKFSLGCIILSEKVVHSIWGHPTAGKKEFVSLVSVQLCLLVPVESHAF